jgi:hypothetical protein
MVEKFFRHGDMVTRLSVVEDPVYLTEPLVRSETLMLNHDATPATFQTHLSCSTDAEIPGWAKGYHPHRLPGENPYLQEFARKYDIPFEATRGGAEGMYPEYREKLRQMRSR